MKNRNRVVFAALALVVIVVAGFFIVRDWVVPTFASPSVTGVPTVANPFAATKGSSVAPASDGISQIAYVDSVQLPIRPQQTTLYRSCTEDRSATPTPTGAAPVATVEATAAATEVAAATPSASDKVVLRIVATESEACYQVGEIFLQNNQFALATGVTTNIDGFVQVDRANVTASQISDININIAEFKSDSGRRDGIIRQRWLESNKFPVATFKEAVFVGLPARAYKDGEVLDFQIKGKLTLKETTKEVSFTVQGALTGDTLVVTGYLDTKMSDFNIEAPNVGGFVRANDEFRIVLNLVARPE